MAWVYLLLAGGFEVVGVMGITLVNKSPSVRSYLLLIGGFVLSFLFLSLSMQSIAMSTAYAVWTGMGTVGGAAVGILIYGESRSMWRI